VSQGRGHRRGLWLVLTLLAVAGVALLAAVGLPRSAPRARVKWEIEPRDPRVSGVFIALEERGLAPALDSLEQRAAQDSAVLRGAHQLAHALGREALIRSGGDPAILAQCRPIFGSGCYHGVVEAFLNLRGRVDMRELREMCAAAGNRKRTGAVYECAHGLGHGVLSAVGLDIGATLSHCDSLDRPNLVTACHEGAFMEAISSAVADRESHGSHSHGAAHVSHTRRITIDREDPYSPCDRYADTYGDACWLFQGFLILRNVHFDAAKALRLCEAAPAGRANRCAESVGHQLAGLFQRSDAWLIEQCGKGDIEPAARCASGAALALVLMDWSGARVNRYCTSVPSAWRRSCFATAGEALARGS
jgi:hypothetical protein